VDHLWSILHPKSNNLSHNAGAITSREKQNLGEGIIAPECIIVSVEEQAAGAGSKFSNERQQQPRV